MGKEIERKFLVRRDLWELFTKPEGCMIRQGYLCDHQRGIIRVRIAGDQGFLTIKNRSVSLSRLEYEYQIPLQDARELFQVFSPPELSKIRYPIFYRGFLWEVDQFLDNNEGLIIAEIELQGEGETFEIPEWISREISGDERYYNASLVKHPFTCW